LNQQANQPPSLPKVAKLFSGTARRLTAAQAAQVYWSAGGRLLGVASLAIFAVTQTTRIFGDWWIRWVGLTGVFEGIGIHLVFFRLLDLLCVWMDQCIT
jgi:hypothetical protein